VKLVGALAAVVVALGVTLAVPGVASADNLGGVITADMNGDGIPDQVQLGRVGGVTSMTCSVTVSYGQPGGGFGAPELHTYAEVSLDFCPNIGIAVKLGDETTPDLLTAASFGESSVVVLHNFQPAATAPGVRQPNWLRTTDLNGDGRQDILLWSSQVDTLTSLINTPQGTLVRGPISIQTLITGGNTGGVGPQYVLADFNRDGGQDMLLSANQTGIYGGNRMVYAEVFFGNGQAPVFLAGTTDFQATWNVFSIDLDYDGIPDAGVIERSGTGVTTVQYFRNDGAGHFTLVP
jgi:hypothetical protein